MLLRWVCVHLSSCVALGLVASWLTDAQFSSTAVIDSAAKIIERVAYDPYGKARHQYRADVDGDGDAWTDDHNAINALVGTSIGQGGYNADADVDHDGDIDTSDYTQASGEGTRIALPQGLISDPAIDNIVGYAGYLFNAEALLYTVRDRHYEPRMGRLIERDPAGYMDGMSLYEISRSSPAIGAFSAQRRVTRKTWRSRCVSPSC